MPDFMIYGATGFTGSLIAREAMRRGLRPILAGRSAESLTQLAGELGLEHRLFALDLADANAAGLHGIHTLLNCAGPFSKTARPLADACLSGKTHYLDITGEIGVIEDLAVSDAAAKKSGVVLLPGVGFDVVPTDCLALQLKQRLPTATHLVLGFQSAGRMSRGTALTMVERINEGGVVRENGELRGVPTAWKTRTIDFGNGPSKAITIPWGDIATAYRSTGIPNIEVYLAMPRGLRIAARLSRWFGWFLGSRFVQASLRRRILAGPPGPTEVERQQNRCYLWGEATDDAGGKVISRLQTPDGYDLTVLTALAAAERVLSGKVPAGFQTPAKAFGAEFVLGIAGVSRSE